MRLKEYLTEEKWEVVRKGENYYLIDTTRADPWSNPQRLGAGEKARQNGLKSAAVRNKSVSEERAVWRDMSRDELKKFRKKCKHDWVHDKSLLSGEFFRCKNCGCEGKQIGKEVRRISK